MKNWMLSLILLGLSGWLIGPGTSQGAFAQTQPSHPVLTEQDEVYHAKYIWYPEPFEQCVAQKRYFRRTFDLAAVPARLDVALYEDDSAVAYINGVKAPNIRSFNAAPFLKPGKNVIALCIYNALGPACLVARMADPDSPFRIFSDTSWKSFKTEKEGWNTLAFDDSDWLPCRIVSELSNGVWIQLMDIERFMEPGEIAMRNERKAKRIERRTATLKMLAAEKPCPTKIEYVKGSPWIVIGTRRFPGQIFNAGQLDMSLTLHRKRVVQLAQQDLHLYGICHNLSKYWIQGKAPDFSPLIDNLIDIVVLDPDAHFTVLINLEPPKWFVEKYPNENIGYATGPAQFGKDDIANTCISSFASKLFREEAAKLLTALIQQVEHSPIAPRVFGYHPSYGVYTEWHYYGMSVDMPDTGPAMTQAFRKMLKQKYKTDAALRKSWDDSSVTLDTAQVPGKEARTKRTLLSLRDPASAIDRRNLDYLECHRDVWFDCLRWFDTSVKQACSGRALVGNYVAYFFGMTYPVEGWHQYQDRLLDSDFSDYQTAPTPYSPDFRALGHPGGMRSVAESHRLRGKMHVMEADTRTHRTDVPSHRHTKNIEETLSLLTRDFCVALTNGSAFWRYDFGLGWYDEKPMMDLIGKTIQIARQEADASSVAQVAVVCDFDSAPYHTYSHRYSAINLDLIIHTYNELCYTGTPFDLVTLHDLALPGAKEYKVYVFLNSFYLDAAKRKQLQNLATGDKTFVWLYAAGLIDENGAKVGNMKQATGMNIGMINTAAGQIATLDKKHSLAKNHAADILPFEKYRQISEGPVFYIDDPSVETFGTIKCNGKNLPALGVKKTGTCTSIYSAIPFLDRTILRNIFAQAGVHLYCADEKDVVYVCRSFIGLHTGYAGTKTIALPSRAKKVTQLLPKTKVCASNVSEFQFEAPVNSTTLFLVEY